MKKIIALFIATVILCTCFCIPAFGSAAICQGIFVEVTRKDGSQWQAGDSLDEVTCKVDPIEGHVERLCYVGGTAIFEIRMDGTRQFFLNEKVGATVNGESAQVEMIDTDLYKITASNYFDLGPSNWTLYDQIKELLSILIQLLKSFIF